MFTVTMTTDLRIDVFGDHAYFVIHACPEVPFSTVGLRIFPVHLKQTVHLRGSTAFLYMRSCTTPSTLPDLSTTQNVSL